MEIFLKVFAESLNNVLPVISMFAAAYFTYRMVKRDRTAIKSDIKTIALHYDRDSERRLIVNVEKYTPIIAGELSPAPIVQPLVVVVEKETVENRDFQKNPPKPYAWK